jgi:hypothetical protein
MASTNPMSAKCWRHSRTMFMFPRELTLFWPHTFMKCIAFVVAINLGFSASTDADELGLEYRLNVKDGRPFQWANDSKEELLSSLPFMTSADFTSAVAKKSTNPNTPGEWEVQLAHTAVGRAKFRAVADSDRAREYCLLFRSMIWQCAAFPPGMKDVYDRGATITHSFSRADAEKMAAEIRKSLK